jgi:peptidoglycan/LPS O-acetylase OafA/YrhL
VSAQVGNGEAAPDGEPTSGGDPASNGKLANARVLRAPRGEAVSAIIPLLVIALGFVTPPVLLHHRAHVVPISPLQDGFSPLWSIQITAFVLALIGLVCAKARREPGRAATIVAAVGTLAVLHVAASMMQVAGADEWRITAVSAAVLAAALAAIVLAVRTRGWRGWLWALGAYGVAALPYACPLWPGIFNEFSGGLTFIAADVTLLILVVLGLRRR